MARLMWTYSALPIETWEAARIVRTEQLVDKPALLALAEVQVA